MRILLLLLFFVFPVNADQHIIEQENFEAWQFTCVEEQSQKICDLRELVFDQNTEEVVSYLSIMINYLLLVQIILAVVVDHRGQRQLIHQAVRSMVQTFQLSQ